MKIALIGYGKIGKLIEKIAESNGDQIVTCIDSKRSKESIEQLISADVCIDFSHPTTLLSNVEMCARLKKNIVVGTTGWDQDLPKVEKIVKEHNIGLLYSPNFSIGVALFMEMTKLAAKLFADQDGYDVSCYEEHHKHKADAPSGTAKALADILLANIPSKKKIVSSLENRLISPDELHLSYKRSGECPGIHSISFDSYCDTITLTHTARNREGFALGALQAAKWLQDKKGIYQLKDMLCLS